MKRAGALGLAVLLILVITQATYAEVFKRGSDSYDVLLFQKRLIELGYLVEEADGVYGKKTETAVKEFQKANGLSITGKADEKTQKVAKEHSAVLAPGFTPAPTPLPTPAPKSTNGFIQSDDSLIMVPSVYKITKDKEYINYYLYTVDFKSSKSGKTDSIPQREQLDDLLDYANEKDLNSEIICRPTNVTKLVDGVYYVYFDISLGGATKTYSQVVLASKYFPNDFGNGDEILIKNCIPSIKKRLKNPNSLILRSVTATNYSNVNAIKYGFEISAQNGFGGYSNEYMELVYNIEDDLLYYYDSYYSWMDERYLDDRTERQYLYE